MKNSDHYFKCVVGDEVRMFRDSSLEAVGMYVKLRNFSFDSDPIGFLVDHHHRPFDSPRLADAVGEKHARFRALFDEIRTQKLIQSVPEFGLFLTRLAVRNLRARKKAAIFEELVGQVWPSTPTSLDEVFLLPQLLDQRLERINGERNGKKGGNPDLVKEAGWLTGVVNQGGYPPPLTGVVNPHSHSHSQKNLERETLRAARATPEQEAGDDAGAGGPRLPSPARFDFLLEQFRQFHVAASVREMQAADPESYAMRFEERLGYTPAEFDALRDAMDQVRRPRASAYVLRMPAQRKPKRSGQLPLGLGGEVSHA